MASKSNQKLIRLATVMAYVLAVSLAAIDTLVKVCSIATPDKFKIRLCLTLTLMIRYKYRVRQAKLRRLL